MNVANRKDEAIFKASNIEMQKLLYNTEIQLKELRELVTQKTSLMINGEVQKQENHLVNLITEIKNINKKRGESHTSNKKDIVIDSQNSFFHSFFRFRIVQWMKLNR